MQGQQEPKKDKSLLSRESAEDEVIRHFEEAEGTKNMIADLAEGSNSDLEQWIQTFTELTGLDDEQNKTEAHGIIRAVGARRKEPGRETTAAQEQGKKVCFIEEEREAQEAREWQEHFIERRKRAQEARVDERRDQEKMCEEGDDARVREVANMEACGSYLQTSDPRAEVEKVVIDGLEKRKTGRGSDGLVRGGEYWCQSNEANGQGKGKGGGGNG